jgi:hypothetical protein
MYSNNSLNEDIKARIARSQIVPNLSLKVVKTQ